MHKTSAVRPGKPARGPARRGVLVRVASVALGAFSGTLLGALAGCASAPKPPRPTLVKATLQASTAANPDLRERASPLVLRLYELKSAAAFDAADFLSLYDRDQATLGAEMLGREEFTLRPGGMQRWDKAVGPEVRFIGVIAAFRDIERARWKTLIALQPNLSNTVAIKVDEITVTGTVVAA